MLPPVSELMKYLTVTRDVVIEVSVISGLLASRPTTNYNSPRVQR